MYAAITHADKRENVGIFPPVQRAVDIGCEEEESEGAAEEEGAGDGECHEGHGAIAHEHGRDGNGLLNNNNNNNNK